MSIAMQISSSGDGFMGFEDRQYNREQDYGNSYSPSSYGTRSIVVTIILINVAVFVIYAFTPLVDGGGTHFFSKFLGIQSDQPWFIWTYLTYGFAHASFGTEIGFWHIFGNMLALFFLGRPVEERLGRDEFLKFYLISIVVAGLGFTLVHLIFGIPFSFIVGASGAVSAVVALFIFMYPREKILLMGVIPMPAWGLGVLLLLSNLYSAFKPDSHIAWEAHAFGAAFGVAYYLQRWNFSRLDLSGFARLFKSRPKLKVHQPGGVDEKLQTQADSILEKISLEGEESLTSKERRILNKYSAQIRKNRD